jgi:hypothetical protein
MAVYTVVAQDNIAQRKAIALANKFSPLIVYVLSPATDGAKTGVIVTTVWTDSKFVFVATDGSLAILAQAEYVAFLALLAASL